MNKRKIKKLTYKYFEQYNIEYFSIPQIDDIDIFNNSESFGQFDIDTMYKRQYILKVDSTLFDEKESFINQILFHEFTHMYDSLKFLDYDKETFKKLMNIYSEIHATEIEMNVILSTKNGNIITTHESMTLKKYMNDSLHCMENQFILSDNSQFNYREFYYFIGKLISLNKHGVTYNYEFSSELPTSITSLFKEIINYFIDNSQYDYDILCKFSDQISNIRKQNIAINYKENELRSALSGIGMGDLLNDIFKEIKQNQ